MTPLSRSSLSPSARRAGLAATFMMLVLAIGTGGYVLLGLPVLDALYQTAITVTTVGFTEIIPGDEPTTAYRLFTLALVLTGVTAVLFAAGVFVDSLVENRTGSRRGRRMQREIDKMSGHVIVCGYGRVGRAVGARAAVLSDNVVVIDEDKAAAAGSGFPHLVGDATQDDTLAEAGVMRAAALVAALPSDAANLFLAVSARQLNPSLRIVCRANDHDSARKLRGMEIDTVVEPYEIAGTQLATAAIRPHTSDYLEQVFSDDAPNVELSEVTIASRCDLVGMQAGAVGDSYGVVVVAVRPTGSSDFVSTARHTDELQGGDVMIVLGDRQSVNDLRQHAH